MIWSFFNRYLFSKKAGSLIRVISWLCFVGVTLGVMAMVVVLSVMSGFGENMKERLLSVEPHLVVHSEKRSERNEVLESLKKNSEVEAIEYEAQDLIVRTPDGNFGGGVATGFSEVSLKKMIKRVEKIRDKQVGSEASSNSFFISYAQIRDRDFDDNEVILGVDLARSLGVYEGDEIIGIAPEALLLPAGEAPPVAK